jgi:MOSC domain-containing protein YiiM
VSGQVVAVSCSAGHRFSKENQLQIRLRAGLGVEGDVHATAAERHRSGSPTRDARPNLRQVHLLHAELFDELAPAGFRLKAGDIGENITTRGLDLLGLPLGTRLHLGATAVVRVTGLREPCSQLDRFQRGLKAAMLVPDASSGVAPRCGIMAVVVADGDVAPGDPIHVELPDEPHSPLEPL